MRDHATYGPGPLFRDRENKDIPVLAIYNSIFFCVREKGHFEERHLIPPLPMAVVAMIP